MHPLRLIRFVALVVALGVLPACRTTPLNKQEAADWYTRYGSMVRWVGYQGSDQQFHYYIARVMDDWNFIRIRRDELKVDDERPFSRASSAPLYYYLVDPRHDYQRVAVKTVGEPDGSACRSQPVSRETNRASSPAGSGV